MRFPVSLAAAAAASAQTTPPATVPRRPMSPRRRQRHRDGVRPGDQGHSPGKGTLHRRGPRHVHYGVEDRRGDMRQFGDAREAGQLPSRGDPGFSEGLQLMVIGEKRRLWVPRRSRKGTREPEGCWCSTSTDRHPDARAGRREGPPADAKTTASGLASRLEQGVGGRHPRPTAR
jgi:hypothetical protein